MITIAVIDYFAMQTFQLEYIFRLFRTRSLFIASPNTVDPRIIIYFDNKTLPVSFAF